ncbi:MAG: sensor histidine kinase [Ktedonobacteraceae bacterium]|jgi:two-component system, OmpR family, sensor kinase
MEGKMARAKSAAHKRFSLPGLPRSLCGRLVLWNVVVLLLTLAVLESVVYAVVSTYLMANVDAQLQLQAAKLQSITQTWQLDGHPFDNSFLDQLVIANQGDEFTSGSPYIKLLDARDGHILRRSPNLGRVRLPFILADFTAALQNQSRPNTYQDSSGRQVRILTLALHDTKQHVVVVAQVSQSLEAVQQVRLILALVLASGGLCAALIAYAVGSWVTRRELRPLHVLSTTMLNLSAQGLGMRLSPRKPTAEMQQLTDAFNQMSERLEASFALQRAFVADVSHELRTPLTSIRGQIDVLLMNPALEDEAHQDVQQIRAELGRLSRLVNNLLTNARAEAGVLPEVNPDGAQRVELDVLVIEVARQARFLNQRVSLQLGHLQQVSVPGDADMLKQLMLNLVDNALTYTQPGGKVSITLTCTRPAPEVLKQVKNATQDDWAMVEIHDTGPGIAPADLPHIFERHYRANRLHARGKLSSGLGLSIALLIARVHGGTITVESVVDRGTCFRVWLPGCEEVAASQQAS